MSLIEVKQVEITLPVSDDSNIGNTSIPIIEIDMSEIREDMADKQKGKWLEIIK